LTVTRSFGSVVSIGFRNESRYVDAVSNFSDSLQRPIA